MVKRSAFGRGLGPIVALGAIWGGSAQADPLTAAQILQNYNLVTKGNALTTSDIEGSSAVGGSFSGATIFNNTHSTSTTSPQSLYVFGTLTNSNPLNINDLGAPHPAPTLFYNGMVKPPPVNFNGRSSQAAIPAGTTISDYTTPLDQLEATLAAEAANNTANTSDMNNFKFDATSYNAQGLAVFDITASELETAGGISVAGFAPGETIVINVTDISGNVLLKGNPLAPSANTADQVIWNFEAPTTPGSYTIYDAGGLVRRDARRRLQCREPLGYRRLPLCRYIQRRRQQRRRTALLRLRRPAAVVGP
jgi:choice-of-anchor A domain-containing protein